MSTVRKYLAFFVAVGCLCFCAGCSGLDSLADGLKGGVEQLGNDIAIGKSNAIITPYQSFAGIRNTDKAGFKAEYDADVIAFEGQDILVGNTDMSKNDCRKVTVSYKFDTEKGTCILFYLDSELEQTILADSGSGETEVELQPGANYIGISGNGYEGHIRITVK